MARAVSLIDSAWGEARREDGGMVDRADLAIGGFEASTGGLQLGAGKSNRGLGIPFGVPGLRQGLLLLVDRSLRDRLSCDQLPEPLDYPGQQFNGRLRLLLVGLRPVNLRAGGLALRAGAIEARLAETGPRCLQIILGVGVGAPPAAALLRASWARVMSR